MVMKKILEICFLFMRILVVPVCSVPTNQDKLVSVAVIMRHGERTFKQKTYPNDPHRNFSFGHKGIAQLTNKGMQQAFGLGQWLREQYDEFLPRWYTGEEIYVISSDEDRSIMTAQCALAGLYPPEPDDKWNAQLLWQPIPVHTIPKGDDIITYNSRKCPNFAKRVKEIVISDEHFNKIDNENIQFFRNLSDHLGVEIKTFWDIQNYYDILRIQELLNLTLPSWTRGIYPDKILPLVELRLQAHTYTPALKRLSVGPLLNKILTYFQNTISDIHEEPKFLMFSSHRSKLTNLLFSLNFENIGRNIPNCGDMLIFELKQRISKRNLYYVNILYKQDVSSEPKYLVLKNCDEDCNYDALVQILKPITVDLKQWEKECYSEETSRK